MTGEDAAARQPSQAEKGIAIASAIYLAAVAAWGGGLVVLGAIVAPAVFRIVPAPSSADAMTTVFRRFDRVAITCAAIAFACEATLAVKGGRVMRRDLVRGAAAVVAGTLAIAQGAYFSPTIEGLHREGAIRGLGALGEALEKTHRLAEVSGKAQLVLLLVVLALVVEKLARRPAARRLH